MHAIHSLVRGCAPFFLLFLNSSGGALDFLGIAIYVSHQFFCYSVSSEVKEPTNGGKLWMGNSNESQSKTNGGEEVMTQQLKANLTNMMQQANMTNMTTKMQQQLDMMQLLMTRLHMMPCQTTDHSLCSLCQYALSFQIPLFFFVCF